MKCTNPYIVYHSEFQTSEYPCGRCLACRQLRARDWSQRIKYELEDKKIMGDFVTLTFDDLRSTPLERMYTNKSHIQKFIKRVRRSHPLKFFAASEYGEKFRRPHYHLIILRNRESEIDYSKYWTKGNIDVGSVTDASIAYVTGYLLKKNAVPKDLPKDARPRHYFSRGIGDGWMTGKTYIEMAREGNIPRRWRALADEKELPSVRFIYPKDKIKGWEKLGRRKQQEAFADGRR